MKAELWKAARAQHINKQLKFVHVLWKPNCRGHVVTMNTTVSIILWMNNVPWVHYDMIYEMTWDETDMIRYYIYDIWPFFSTLCWSKSVESNLSLTQAEWSECVVQAYLLQLCLKYVSYVS